MPATLLDVSPAELARAQPVRAKAGARVLSSLKPGSGLVGDDVRAYLGGEVLTQPEHPFFTLHSLSASPIEIPERFSSSLLPPSFVSGRCTAVFLPRDASFTGGVPFSLATASGEVTA
jgi:hypothetical protein